MTSPASLSNKCGRKFHLRRMVAQMRHRAVVAPFSLAAHVTGAAVLCFGATVAYAQAPTEQMQRFDVPAGSLAEVLNHISQQTGRSVDLEPGVSLDVPSPGLRGSFTPSQAFSQALQPHGLFALTAAGGVRIAHEPVATRELEAVRVLGTAEEELKQQLSVSIITAEDLQIRPPATDLSEIIRTVPGVNLTGASSSGAYGNQRQIDIRGMGPENTLVLIDGKPVRSREAAQMRRSGERDTRGDTNWVPADQVERIEVIRGPAAARYGSGAAGGVVNIITKPPTDKISGSLTGYYNQPENGDEGNARRIGFNLSGPLNDKLSFRLYGNAAKTNADSPDINADEVVSGNAAGREGVRNRDINGLLRLDINPDHVVELDLGFSRQGNAYTGEYPVNVSDEELIEQLANDGAEVRRTYRQTAALTHRGDWGKLGNSRVILQYEDTRNLDCRKNSAGGPEGSCASPLSYLESNLKNLYANGELYTPFTLGGLSQVLTTGIEYRHESLKDPNTLLQAPPSGVTQGTDPKSTASSVAFYLEDNIEITDDLIVTPGVRLDHHNQFGSNWSPSLNATYQLSSDFSLKGGIARAYKAPNLYQSNENYWYTTRGNGCPINVSGPCYIQGNPDLKPEISVNKEIGVQWDNHQGWDASVSYFRNDYKNKITADMYTQGTVDVGTYKYYQWHNSGKALVQGLEGNLNIPLLGESGHTLSLLNNFTWMLDNKDRETDQPLSIIPKYTLNSTLLWRPVEQLSAQLTMSWYGTQKPRTLTARGADAEGAALDSVSPYAVIGLNTLYDVNKNLRIGVGISNLFDKVIKRRSNGVSGGAYTYNEPGRAYYLTTTVSF